jgi:hypothetical protein
MRYWRVILIVSPAIFWTAAVVWAIAVSLDPNQYFRYEYQEAEPFEYPIADVALVMLAFLVELGVFYGIVRPWARPIGFWRLATCLALFAAWLWACSYVVVHAPGYMHVHLIWLLFATAVLTTAAVVVGGIRLWSLANAHHAA